MSDDRDWEALARANWLVITWLQSIEMMHDERRETAIRALEALGPLVNGSRNLRSYFEQWIREQDKRA